MLTPNNKSGVVIPIVHKVDFRAPKKVTRDRGHNHFKHLQTPIIEPRYTQNKNSEICKKSVNP